MGSSLVRLSIDNSTCNIEGISIAQFKELKDLLSYDTSAQAAYFSGNFRSTKRSLLGKKGDFPTGLLYLVKDYLKKHQLKHTCSDLRKRPKALESTFNLSLGVTPYPEQENAALACLKRSRGIVVASTGFGKSIVIALIIDKLKVPTLIVVPSLELKKQLTDSLKTMFGKSLVGSLGHTIAVENVDALDHSVKSNGYDCVIIDEFHHSGASTYRKLNKNAWSNVYYKFGLTATPFRSKDEERLLMESVLSQVIYRVEHATAVEKGYIAPIEAYYYELPTKKEVEGYTWAEVYSELVVNNKDRNLIVATILGRLHQSGASTLCLVKEIKHGLHLATLTGFEFAQGINTNNKELINAFNSKEISTLIGTTGVIGEGIDTKPAEYIVIAGLGKSKNALMQQFGRGFRTYPGKESCKIILFKDNSHKWTKSHFAEQVKVLKLEYGVTPVKLIF